MTRESLPVWSNKSNNNHILIRDSYYAHYYLPLCEYWTSLDKKLHVQKYKWSQQIHKCMCWVSLEKNINACQVSLYKLLFILSLWNKFCQICVLSSNGPLLTFLSTFQTWKMTLYSTDYFNSRDKNVINSLFLILSWKYHWNF